MLRTLTLALLSFFTLGCASQPVAVAPGVVASPESAHDRGVAFLVKHQNSDGSWGTFESARPGEIYLGNLSSHRAFREATSALCVMALIEPSRTHTPALAALMSGMEHLLHAPLPSRANGDTFYDTWAHTYMVQAFARLAKDPRFAHRSEEIKTAMARSLTALYERQGADGGWGYYDFKYTLARPSGDMSTSFNTAAALIALHEARASGFAVPDAVIQDGLRCLSRLRLPSGAYVYGTYAQYNPAAVYNKVKGSLGRSQSCNVALWLNQGNISQDDLRAGLEHLRNEHHFIEIGKGRPYPHEAWYATAGYYFFFGHYYAARAVNVIEAEDSLSDGDSHRTWLSGTMARLQDPDGSWFDFPLYGYHRAYGTALALLTLQECLAVRQGSSIEGSEVTVRSTPVTDVQLSSPASLQTPIS